MADLKDDVVDVKVPSGVDVNQVEAAIKALVKFAAKSKEESLFLDDHVRVLMDVKAFKIPNGTDHFFNIRLPHSPYTDLTELDVLLVVPDVPDRDPDHVVGEVRDVLMGSTHADKINVRQIMTLKQFRDDYATFEAKRALCKSVDAVIAEKKVWKMIPGILGKEFMKKKKFPLSIPGRKFRKEDVGAQIWFVLNKTVMNLSLTGQTSTVVVGHDNRTEDELVDNTKAIVSWLNKNFPGGWQNIQKISLHIGHTTMPPLPIYFSEASRNDVAKRPRTKREVAVEPIEGEITTQLGKRIKILPTGDIKVFKDEDRDELDDIL